MIENVVIYTACFRWCRIFLLLWQTISIEVLIMQLLRGKLGFIHSWRLSPTEGSVWEDGNRVLQEFPEVVYVKFPGATWQLDGTSELGIYPITYVKRNWFSDKGRKYPQLAVQRQQLPLVPAFSWTAHTAQGQTLEAAIVDMQIGAGTSPMASYVAFTRVKKTEDLLAGPLVRASRTSRRSGSRSRSPTSPPTASTSGSATESASGCWRWGPRW